ncbi:TlpA family protein disulfide reductase [Granulicella cerasi]|uniref:TlpA family protein disulfide reductase n=1 Tax=Granulicella cerasi TaxID=741063 RepID=A0ABW1Z5E5_9BACT
MRPEQLGTTAPNFSITNGSKSINSQQLRGKLVLLNFWASWCAPCLEELPSLEDLHHQMPQVELVGISIDSDSSAYEYFLKLHHVDFTTYIDQEQRVNAQFGTFRPPESYVIDQNGVIRRKFIGPQTWNSPEIVDYLKKLSAAR